MAKSKISLTQYIYINIYVPKIARLDIFFEGLERGGLRGDDVGKVLFSYDRGTLSRWTLRPVLTMKGKVTTRGDSRGDFGEFGDFMFFVIPIG